MKTIKDKFQKLERAKDVADKISTWGFVGLMTATTLGVYAYATQNPELNNIADAIFNPSLYVGATANFLYNLLK